MTHFVVCGVSFTKARNDLIHTLETNVFKFSSEKNKSASTSICFFPSTFFSLFIHCGQTFLIISNGGKDLLDCKADFNASVIN